MVRKKRKKGLEREKKYIHQILLRVIRWDSVQGSDGLDNRDLSLKKSDFILSSLVIHPIFNHVQ